MSAIVDRRPATPCSRRQRHPQGRLQCFFKRWFLTNSLLAGLFALLWLLLRSGSKPSRLTYPCQQAAFSTATLAFAAPLVSTLIAARSRIVAGLRSPVGLALAGMGVIVTVGAWGYFSRAAAYQGPRLDPPLDYRAQLFHVTDCPQDPVGDRFAGVDNLINLMGREGLKFYRSADQTAAAGPDGIIAPDDVVVIKINYQWDQRGGSNVDVLRGLILRILDHPDIFTGEIVVCENTQFVTGADVDGFNRTQNNAQDISLSPHDVVVGFAAQGHTISHYAWRPIRETSVAEYSSGNMTDGYVVYPYDSDLHGRLSYPKFRTNYGTYISLKYGIWDPASQTYDREHLKFINLPVLKSHHSTYGVTACVKHYMGVVSGGLSTSSHSAIAYGLLGAVQGEIQRADLNILDCIWINANPYSGPSTSYSGATRRDELVASLDPVAADIWSVKRILIPAFRDNGYAPPWPYPSADPDDPSSAFRNYLDHSMDYLLAAGYDATNDLASIDAYAWDGAGDRDGDSDVDLADFGEFQTCTGPVVAGCEDLDLTGDGLIDFKDYQRFEGVFTGPGIF